MFDVLLKINGNVGESTDGAHKGWIEILGFNCGVSQPMGGKRSRGRPRHTPSGLPGPARHHGKG